MVSNNDIIIHPDILYPNGYGWTLYQDGWAPVMSIELPAPQGVSDAMAYILYGAF